MNESYQKYLKASARFVFLQLTMTPPTTVFVVYFPKDSRRTSFGFPARKDIRCEVNPVAESLSSVKVNQKKHSAVLLRIYESK